MLRLTTRTTASPSAMSGVDDTRAPLTVLVLRLFSPRLPGATMIPPTYRWSRKTMNTICFFFGLCFASPLAALRPIKRPDACSVAADLAKMWVHSRFTTRLSPSQHTADSRGPKRDGGQKSTRVVPGQIIPPKTFELRKIISPTFVFSASRQFIHPRWNSRNGLSVFTSRLLFVQLFC